MSIGRLLARAARLRVQAKLIRNAEQQRDLNTEADRLTAEAEAQSQAKEDAAAFARLVKDNGGSWFPGD